MAPTDILAHASLQASYLSKKMGRKVAGGLLLAGFLQKGKVVLKDLEGI